MYFSRIRLRPQHLNLVQLRELMGKGMYAAHQLLWQLFPNCHSRNFLFRQEIDTAKERVFPLYYVVSELSPQLDIPLFQIETKPYAPQISNGQQFCFNLRANPVVTKFRGENRNGQRHDVLMAAKQVAKRSQQQDCWPIMQHAAIDWLNKRAERCGFFIQPEKISVDGYRQHSFTKKSQQSPIQFSSIDYTGILQVTDRTIFEKSLFEGVGRAKAFGCGLLLIRR